EPIARPEVDFPHFPPTHQAPPTSHLTVQAKKMLQLAYKWPFYVGKLSLGSVFPGEDFASSVDLKNCLQMEMKRVLSYGCDDDYVET
ncbi:hypothetical protein M5D96_004747, partial [Drosophila gunungcola]